MVQEEREQRTDAQDGSDETLVGTVKKNAAEQLRITTSTFHGHDLVSIRIYFEQVTGSGDWRPTRKGVCFRRELLPEVIDLLQRAADSEEPRE